MLLEWMWMFPFTQLGNAALTLLWFKTFLNIAYKVTVDPTPLQSSFFIRGDPCEDRVHIYILKDRDDDILY